MTKYLFTAGALALAIVFANAANASYQITLDDGSGPFTVVDGDSNDSNPLSGAISWANGAGHTFANISLSVSSFSNSPGASFGAGLNTTQFDITAAVAKTLSIVVFDDGFSLPGVAGDVLKVMNSLVGNHTLGGSATASQTTELDGVATAAATVAISSADVNDTDQTTAFLVRGGPFFTLETLVSASINANSNVNFTHTSSAVIPEPMTLVIWAGMFSVGALGIFRRQRNA